MWRRTYLLLLLIRVYFALSPSYLHPDENFQGPEVFAGTVPLPQVIALYRMSDFIHAQLPMVAKSIARINRFAGKCDRLCAADARTQG